MRVWTQFSLVMWNSMGLVFLVGGAFRENWSEVIASLLCFVVAELVLIRSKMSPSIVGGE